MAKPKKAFSFAHLIGLGAARADGEPENGNDDQDDERKQGDDESDEDYAKRMEELDKKEAAEAQGDPDAEDDTNESDKEKAARVKERARCASIFGAKAAASRPDFAAHLAFETSMSAKQAIGMLAAFAAGAPAAAAVSSRQSLARRMGGVALPNVGASSAAGPANPASAAANMILAAGKQRRGEA